MTDVEQRVRKALDSFTGDDISANAVSDVITYADLRDFLAALESAEAERDKARSWGEELYEGLGRTVGERDRAETERDGLRGQVERVEKAIRTESYDASDDPSDGQVVAVGAVAKALRGESGE